MNNKILQVLKKNSMLVALIIVMILFQILIVSGGKGSLFAPRNITNLINQNSYVVILATGMLLCILTGGNIDLSVGSIVALVGAIAGVLIVNNGMNPYLAIIICLLVGIGLGAWQAFWIAYIKIPPFIVTLSGMLLFRGLALIILDGLTISPFPDNYLKLFTSQLPGKAAGKSAILMTTLSVGIIICVILIINTILKQRKKVKKGYATTHIKEYVKLSVICAVTLIVAYLLGLDRGIPVVLILLAVIVFVYSYYTEKTVPGRYLYAIGGNENAAKMSGVNTEKMMFFAYTNMGFLSAVAALVCVGRFNSAAPSAGNSYELDAIGSCFIGGASAYGGTGTVTGAVIGAMFMGVLNNGMSILGVDSNWQKAVKGLVLLAAVVFDVVSKKRSSATE